MPRYVVIIENEVTFHDKDVNCFINDSPEEAKRRAWKQYHDKMKHQCGDSVSHSGIKIEVKEF